MEWFAILIMIVLLYIGFNPVWHWTEKQDREYLLNKETYITWLKQSYYVYNDDDLEYLLEDGEVFEKYLKEMRLPWGSELHE